MTFVESRPFRLPAHSMLAANPWGNKIDHKSKNSLRICLLSYRSNPYSGGQGIYIKYLSKALVEIGHEVDVISGQPYPELDQRVKLIKLPGLNLFEAENHVTALEPAHLLSFTDFFEWFSMLTGGFAEPYTFGRRLVYYFKKNKPNYDIVHDNQSLSYGTLQLQKMGIPLLTTIHHPITSDLRIALANESSWQMRLLIRRWHSFLKMQKKVVRQLDHLVTVSEASRKDIANDFKVSEALIKIVPNGIDVDTFRPSDGGERESCTIMVTASADVPLKGLDFLLKAVAEIKDEFPNLKLLVLGKLKKDGNTAQLIKKLGIENLIYLYSELSTEQIVGLYARATCAVVPSVYEGFGLPAGEAMACGVPTITTSGGALPEVVGDSGIIVPTKDYTAIANALRLVLSDSRLREELGLQARNRILRHFSWAIAADKLTTVYQSIINQTAPNVFANH